MKKSKVDGFILAPKEIITQNALTPFERLLLLYIGSFSEFYESAKRTADIFGVSTQTIQKAKQNLIRGRFLIVSKNNGRGKSYILNEKCQWKTPENYVEKHSKIVENYAENLWKNTP